MRARALWGLIFTLGVVCGLVIAKGLFPVASAEMRGDDLHSSYALSEQEWLQTRLDIVALKLSLTGQQLATFQAWIGEDLRIYCRIHIPARHYSQFLSLARSEQRRNVRALVDQFNKEIAETVEHHAPQVRETFDVQTDVVCHVLLTQQRWTSGSVLQEGSPLIEFARFEAGELNWKE